MTMQLPRAFFIRLRQSMCMIIGMKREQRPGRAFSITLKCSIIGRGGIQPWDTGPRYHLNWRLWQPNSTECPKNRGKTTGYLIQYLVLITRNLFHLGNGFDNLTGVNSFTTCKFNFV